MLEMDMEFKKGILFVRLFGILNKETSYKLKRNLTDLIKDNGIKYVSINLKHIYFIDQYGVASILKNYGSVVQNNGKLIICGMNNFNNYDLSKLHNLYQINEESTAFNLVNI